MEDLPVSQLIDRMQNDDRRAFKAIFERYYPQLCDFAESQIDDAEEAEDVVQTIFCDLWRRRADLDPDGNLKAYLYQATRNQCIKRIKRRQVRREWKQREKQRERTSERLGPESQFHHREVREALEEGIEELPDRRRQVFVLSRRHGLTYDEIAETMNISPKTVDHQMVAALKFLRQKLSAFHTNLV